MIDSMLTRFDTVPSVSMVNTDILMPRMSGLDMLEQAMRTRARRPERRP